MASAFFKDEDDMASNSATAVASQQSVKAYVDAVSTKVDTETDGDSPTANDDESNAMVKAHAYLAATSGFVNVRCLGISYFRLYVGSTNDPAGAGTLVSDFVGEQTDNRGTLFAFVGNGKYFEVTSNGTPQAIYWTPLYSGGAAPADQD